MSSRSFIIRSGIALAAGAALAAALAAPASAAPAAASGLTCTDPRTGIALRVTVFGTAGNDTIWARTGDVIETFGGNDRVLSDNATNAVVCLDEGDDIFGPSAFGTPVGSYGVRGGDGADFIIGGTGSDGFFGGPGNDALDGRSGSGTDALNGAAGYDTCANGEVLLACEA
jgi:Ca2+-binding RTX toxin-like protein